MTRVIKLDYVFARELTKLPPEQTGADLSISPKDGPAGSSGGLSYLFFYPDIKDQSSKLIKTIQ